MMKTCDEIRLDNLKNLIEKSGSVTSFSKLIEKEAAQVSQWLNKAKDWKSGKPRKMSDEIARHIEQCCEKERGWMDHDHSDQALELFRGLSAELKSQAMREGDQIAKRTTQKRAAK